MTPETADSRGTSSVPVPVDPSRFVRTVIRPMTKALNPLIVKFAGRRHFGMAAQIQHVGRRSGKVYVTPATAHIDGDVIVIALVNARRAALPLVISAYPASTSGHRLRGQA